MPPLLACGSGHLPSSSSNLIIQEFFFSWEIIVLQCSVGFYEFLYSLIYSHSPCPYPEAVVGPKSSSALITFLVTITILRLCSGLTLSPLISINSGVMRGAPREEQKTLLSLRKFLGFEELLAGNEGQRSTPSYYHTINESYF